MRKERKFKIEGIDKSFEIYELRLRQVISLLEEDSLGDLSLVALKGMLSDKLLPMCSNISLDDLMDMAPSEVEQCYKHFREVNASFFDGFEALGLGTIVQNLKQAIINDFSNLLVTSSKVGIPES